MDFGQAFGSVWARIGLGLAAIGATAVVLWPDQHWTFDVEKLLAALTATALWGWAELTSVGRTPSPHDLGLFEKFEGAYGPAAKNLLRDQDFGHSFIFKKADGLFEMSYWDHAAFEYIDPKIQAKWSDAQSSIGSFSALLARHTGPVAGNPALGSAHPDQGDPDFPADFVVKRIDELNAAAQALFTKLEAFERFARKRLRV